MSNRYCLALDLKDDPQLIAEYERHHLAVWPAILSSIESSGIQHMEIYRIMNRLFMILETIDDFSFENKATMDGQNDIVQQWETLMWHYQQPLPVARKGEKWVLMKKIFEH